MKSNTTIERYLESLYLIESFENIHEGIIDNVIKRLNPNTIKDSIKKIKSSLRNRDISGVKKIINSLKIPSVPLPSLEKMWTKTVPGFPKAYRVAKTTTSNLFPNVPKQTANVGSMIIAGISSIKSKDPEGDTIKNLNKLSSITKTKTESISLKEGAEVGVAIFALGVTIVATFTIAAPGIMASLGATGILIITGLILASLKLLLG